MSGDNSVAMKIGRAYRRLIVEILDESPDWIINYYFAEAQGWAAPKLLTLEECKKDAERYILGHCNGRRDAILKSSPFGKAILYGKKKEKSD